MKPLQIAICDNDLEDLQTITEMTKRYIDTMSLSAEINEYTNSELLSKLIKKRNFDLYILDIIMPILNGIDLGRLIRTYDENAMIVYTTSSREFAFDAWEVRAYHYLEKPVLERELFHLLSEIFEIQQAKTQKSITVRTKDGIVPVFIENIMYIENESRRCVYHLSDGSIVTALCNRTSFEEEAEFVNSFPEFIQSHKSFIVNMHYVRELKTEDFLLDNDEMIPISTKKNTIVKKEFLRYLAGGSH